MFGGLRAIQHTLCVMANGDFNQFFGSLARRTEELHDSLHLGLLF